MLIQFLFWFSLLCIFYVYVGYPLLIALLSLLVHRKVRRDDITPFVSLLITAYNEEKHIGAKLENSLALHYPADRFEIVVASDGSTDATDEIVARYRENNRGIRVRLHRVEGRVGKTATQNSAVAVCRGEIIIFSDAASMYDPEAIRAIVRNYADSEVGAVSGKYTYLDPDKSSAAKGVSTFWNLENFIKSRQSRIRTITGCSGCIYSVRRDLYVDLHPHITGDLVEPLMVLQQGYRIVFEPEALAFEEPAGKTDDEFAMRLRVIVQGMTGLLYVKNLLNPLRYPFVSLQLISHKVMRWLVPVFCLVVLLSSAVLASSSPVYGLLFLGQVLFYLAATLGYFLEKKDIHQKIFYLPLFFSTVNIAALISLFKVLRGETFVVWQTQR